MNSSGATYRPRSLRCASGPAWAPRRSSSGCDRGAAMTKVEEIEKAVTALPAEDFARFREWFEALDAERFDARLEASIKSGRLDALAEEALEDARAGRVRKL